MSRAPASFRLDEPKPQTREKTVPKRKPRAVDPSRSMTVTVDDEDYFAEQDITLAEPPPLPPRKRSWFTRIFATAFSILISLAIGLWVDQLIRDLFTRADWLGWLALAVAAIALFALVAILTREVLGLMRLASIESIRRQASDAAAGNDTEAARKCVADLAALVAGKPQTAAGRKTLDSLKDDVIDGADLIALAERELLAPLDAIARKQVLDAAKRVSVVTAVSPRALLDVAYVLFEATRLTRRIAGIYGGRPGFLGFLRLVRNIFAHLAVTGSMAAGETLVQQIVGHGLAARLSARLGEGLVNGMMTARIGVAAMDAARPLSFSALPRPGIGDFLKALTRFTASEAEQEVTKAGGSRTASAAGSGS